MSFLLVCCERVPTNDLRDPPPATTASPEPHGPRRLDRRNGRRSDVHIRVRLAAESAARISAQRRSSVNMTMTVATINSP